MPPELLNESLVVPAGPSLHLLGAHGLPHGLLGPAACADSHSKQTEDTMKRARQKSQSTEPDEGIGSPPLP